MIDWQYVFKLGWKQRDAIIEKAVRDFLGSQGRSASPFTTGQLVSRLSSNLVIQKALMERLKVMAPYMTGIATHDGETFKLYGKTMRRWQWHGTNGDTHDTTPGL